VGESPVAGEPENGEMKGIIVRGAPDDIEVIVDFEA
jgi:hypothetical protein